MLAVNGGRFVVSATTKLEIGSDQAPPKLYKGLVTKSATTRVFE
jgi:hypothetical protein